MADDMVIDFGGVEEGGDYTPFDKGKYPGQITDAEWRDTKDGSTKYISFEITLIGDKFNGRKVWDTLHFSEAGKKRVKLVLGRLGINVEGKVDFSDPKKLLVKRCAMVEVKIDKFKDDEGNVKEKNKVEYAGYTALPENFVAPEMVTDDFLDGLEQGEAPPAGADDDMPFDE